MIISNVILLNIFFYSTKKNKLNIRFKFLKNIIKLYKCLDQDEINRIILVLVCSLLASCAEIVSISAIIPVISIALGNETNTFNSLFPWIEFNSKIEFTTFILLFLITLFISYGLRFFYLWIQNKVAYSIGHNLCIKVFNGISDSDFSTVNQKPSDYFVTTVTVKLAAVIEGLIVPLFSIMSSLILLIVVFTFALWAGGALALLVIGIISIIYFIIMFVFRQSLKRYSILINKGYEKMSRLALVTKAGYREWKLYRAQSFINKQFSITTNNTLSASASARIISSSPRLVVEPILISLLFLGILFLNDYEGISEYFPIIAAAAFAFQRFMPYIQAAFAGWTYIKSNEEAVSEFLYQVRSTENSNFYDSIDFQDNKITGNIHFSNITFGYNSKKNIFKNFNLKIKKGQFVAVLGQSGSGKSTLVNLLLGFLEPSQGKILPGKTCHTKLGASYVPQEIFIFQGSIIENITLGRDENADLARAKKVIEIVDLGDWLNSFENSLDQIINQDGVGMSGGQKQRLSIARALYQEPKILILDEATNALDSKTETKVLKNLFQFCKSKNTTVIFVTHKKQPVYYCDLTIEM